LFALGRSRRWSFFDMLLLAAAAWFSFRMRRDVWFLTLVSLGVLLKSTGNANAGWMTERAFMPSRPQAMFLSIILSVLVAGVWGIRLPSGAIECKLVEDYPVDAVRFVKSSDCSGPVYNTFDWGGYLIWTLRELPVSMDGRTNLHGDVRLAQAYATWSGHP